MKLKMTVKKLSQIALLAALTSGVSVQSNGTPLLQYNDVNKQAKDLALGAHLGLTNAQYEKFSEYLSDSKTLYEKLNIDSHVQLPEYLEYSRIVGQSH